MTEPERIQEHRESVVARFVNVGGALVELHTARFLTHWTYSGPPNGADKPYEVNGWNWRCRGCAAFGREGETYYDPGFRKLGEARDEAQRHAEQCRAIPSTSAGWEYLIDYFQAKWETLEALLQRHGPLGWELATVNWNAREAVFKRPAGGAR
ncbi:hypothetical protein ACGFI3_42845 [Nonomuraea wenchangensis]|uniref:hypothetical protein n=1 Tax=Nonomuraea wenchangensis TaxID=568860 RepID=UPI00371A91D3